MQTITLHTTIAAPPERCFLLSLSVDLHKASATKTSEQAIAGITSGLMYLDDTVTWRGRHFGLMLTQKTRITAYDKPHFFQDSMEDGLFSTFVHDHTFTLLANHTTLMHDELRFAAPLGPLGRIAEALILRSYLRAFLEQRNQLIKQVAESPTEQWREFIVDA